jgi:hypothetical protein
MEELEAMRKSGVKGVTSRTEALKVATRRGLVRME